MTAPFRGRLPIPGRVMKHHISSLLIAGLLGVTSPVHGFDLEQAVMLEGRFRGIAKACGPTEFSKAFVMESQLYVKFLLKEMTAEQLRAVEDAIAAESNHPGLAELTTEQCHSFRERLKELNMARGGAIEVTTELADAMSNPPKPQ